VSPKGKISAVVVVALCLSAGVGCSNRDSKVADIGYYAGDRPAPIQKLPPRPTRSYANRPMQPRWTPAVTPRRTTPRIAAGPDAGWIPSRGISNRWDSIVIHHSASANATPQGMRDYHMNVRGWDELGYHFVVGNGVNYGDGQVFIGQRWKSQMHGAHCKTPGNHYNDHGIGICLIGDFQTGRPTPKQLDSVARLVRFLMNECGIPQSQILTHGGITGKTACPGRNFSLSAVIQRIDGPRLSSSAR